MAVYKLFSYDVLLSIFKEYDTNNSGAITVSELQNALSHKTKWKLSRKIAQILLEFADKNKSGSVTFDEFGDLYKYLYGWFNCFCEFDVDCNDSLSRSELKDALNKLGYYISNNQIDAYLDEYDHSNTGFLNFNDFIEVCVEVSKRRFGNDIREKILEKMVY